MMVTAEDLAMMLDDDKARTIKAMSDADLKSVWGDAYEMVMRVEDDDFAYANGKWQKARSMRLVSAWTGAEMKRRGMM